MSQLCAHLLPAAGVRSAQDAYNANPRALPAAQLFQAPSPAAAAAGAAPAGNAANATPAAAAGAAAAQEPGSDAVGGP
jgi:hypothetical protein